MVMYYSGMDGHVTALNTAVKNGCSHIMLSYFYRKSYSQLQMRRFRKLGLHIFLDSGAYSAWKKGVAIDIDDYIEYIKTQCIGKYISLDVVGDADKSYENLKYMESKGLQPVPVFHLGSDFKYLDQLVKEDYKYICLGGTVGRRRVVKEEFFDKCFADYPDLYFHGLGVTDAKLMMRYPWQGVDSTTWLNGRKFCQVATMDGRRDLPKDMPIQERLALNVQFFTEVEKKCK